MEIKVTAGDITRTQAGAALVGLFEGATRPEGELAVIDGALEGLISRLIGQGEIKGKTGEITVVHSLGKLAAERVAVVGLGKAGELSPDRVRRAVAEACRRLRQMNVATLTAAVLGAGTAGIGPEAAAQAMTEGALLGTYQFRQHITKPAEHGELKELTIMAAGRKPLPLLKNGCQRGRVMAGAANLARDLVNEPSNYMTPSHLAEAATRIAESQNLGLTVLDRGQMTELGMGALLGVSQGSSAPPKFIILRYTGTEAAETALALVGKGITFDSGGISIKPSEGMGEMKSDMAGGAAVLAAMSALAQLKPGINVTGLVPATENLPGGHALKPGDILTAFDGKTIEIISTDAEGRLILADALGYTRKLGARRIVDVATLTGACRVALGDITTGAFGNNQELMDKIIAAGKETGEAMWPMPMFDEYKELNKSDVADIKNVGGRWGGAITAAQFLAEFAGDTPWVHLDIAGPSMTDKERGYLVKGATGVPVRTLVQLTLSLAAGR